MSNHRPYTAVLCTPNQTKVVEMTASVEWNEAKEQFTEAHPCWNVVAVIAGSHMDRSKSYSQTTSGKKTGQNDRYIDPFDTQPSFIPGGKIK